MEPTEIAGLAEHREALLHGIAEGVIALDRDNRITVVNAAPGSCSSCPRTRRRRLDELQLEPLRARAERPPVRRRPAGPGRTGCSY